jgi:hypothetical protein
MLGIEIWVILAILGAVFWPFFLIGPIFRDDMTTYRGFYGKYRVFFHPVVINICNLITLIIIAYAWCAQTLVYATIALPEMHVGVDIVSPTYAALAVLFFSLVTCTHMWAHMIFVGRWVRLAIIFALLAFAINVTCVVLLAIESLWIPFAFMFVPLIWYMYTIVFNISWWYNRGDIVATIRKQLPSFPDMTK